MPDTNYVYAVIPARYACLYHKLLVLLADYGVDMLNDCSATCKGNNKNIITCWNMFEAGVAAYNLGLTSRAETLMKYVNAQVNIIYRSRGRECPKGEFKLFANEQGTQVAFVSCNGETSSIRIENIPEPPATISRDGIINADITEEDLNE